MLLDFSQLVKKWNIKASSVIQVGSHFGQEYDEYIKNGITNIVFIEPCKKAFIELSRRHGDKAGVTLFNVACGDYEGEATMFTGDETVNKGMSNSLLKPAKHLTLHPEVQFTDTEKVHVIRLDSLGLADKGFQLLVMDCQGYEGYVLKGGFQTLRQVNYVYTEINFDEVYENNIKADELDFLLQDFKRVETGAKVGGMWSDCLFIRKSLLPND